MIRDAIGYFGLALIVSGVWLYSRPAAVIVAGVFLLGGAIFGGNKTEETAN